MEKAFDPVLDYLTSFEWDGKPRLDTWLVRYLGATDDPLNRAIGRKVLIAAVRRVRVPGTKFDQVMVLEGKGGTGKSTAIQVLAGEFFCDQEILKAHGREVQELCTGVWLYEISELAGLSEANVERVKAFVSRTHDKARPAYGTVTVERGRRCIFIGTCNRDDYLIDETGNRRFWPVATTTIDLDALRRDRDQLWAEAVVAEATSPPGLENCALHQLRDSRDGLTSDIAAYSGKVRLTPARAFGCPLCADFVAEICDSFS